MKGVTEMPTTKICVAIATEQLTGTPKQIQWAENVRKKKMSVWKREHPQLFKVVEDNLLRECRAVWWIEYCDKDLVMVINYLLNHPKKTTSKSVQNTSNFTKRPLKGHISIGELRDVKTGEIVIDDNCPF